MTTSTAKPKPKKSRDGFFGDHLKRGDLPPDALLGYMTEAALAKAGEALGVRHQSGAGERVRCVRADHRSLAQRTKRSPLHNCRPHGPVQHSVGAQVARRSGTAAKSAEGCLKGFKETAGRIVGPAPLRVSKQQRAHQERNKPISLVQYNTSRAASSPIPQYRRRIIGTAHDGPAWTRAVGMLRGAALNAVAHACNRKSVTADAVGTTVIDTIGELDKRSLHVLAVVYGVLLRASKHDQ